MSEKNYKLVIKPAIEVEHRHEIEDVLTVLGYKITGGGTDTDFSQCDIAFEGR